MTISFKPLADRVLIEPVAAEQKTASGIIIPDSAKEKPPAEEASVDEAPLAEEASVEEKKSESPASKAENTEHESK